MFDFNQTEKFARTKIIGVGDFGAKLVNYSIANMIFNVEFAVVATKNETLLNSSAPQRLKVSDNIDEVTKNNLSALVKDLELLFIFTDLIDENISTQIAQLSKDILTVAIVPDSAPNRENFQNLVDFFISIEDDNIFLMYSAVRCINNFIGEPKLTGYVVYEDAKNFLKNNGKSYVTYAKATGETPTFDAMESAINSIKNILSKSKRVFFCVVSRDRVLSTTELYVAMTTILPEVIQPEAKIIWSATIDATNADYVEVIMIAAGCDEE